MGNKVDLFDLDEVVQEERYIKLGGQEYKVEETSVGDYIQLMKEERKEIKRNKNKEDMTEATFERMLKSVKHTIPTCPEEKLRNLTPKQLFGLIAWLNHANSDVEEGEEEQEKS